MGLLKKIFGERQPAVPFLAVTDETFADMLRGAEKPVMLFLYSNTCPYCHKMAINVKNILQRNAERIVGMHANAGESPGIAKALDLRGVPATAFFHQGRLLEMVPGFAPEEAIEQIIDHHFGGGTA